MTDQKSTFTPNFSKLTNYATSIFDLKIHDIECEFPHHVSAVVVPSKGGLKGSIIEIRFDKEQATISCTFTHDNLCDATYLFFDIDMHAEAYIEYLKSQFFYNSIEDRWNIANHLMSIKHSDGVTFFMFYPSVSNNSPN